MSLKTFSPFKVGGVVGCTTSSAGLTLVLATVVYRNRLTLGEAGVGEKCGLLLLLGLLQLFVIVLPILVYRIWFHPLCRYPGPFWAKVSDWYTVYHCYVGGRHLDLYRLHLKYGKIVRFGPDRVSICSLAALREIYNTQANVQKSQVHEAFTHFFKTRMSMTTIDREEHAFKRRVNIKALTLNAIKDLEGRLIKNIDLFCANLLDEVPSKSWNSAKDMSKWSAYLASDIQGDVTFTRNWNVLQSSENRNVVEILPQGVQGLYVSGHMPAILTLQLDKLLFSKLTKETYAFQRLSKDQAEWRSAQGQKADMKDIFSALEKARDPETGRTYTPVELVSEAGLFIVAGSDTTSTVISAVVFYLLHNPESLRLVQQEVRSAFDSLADIRIGSRLNACQYLFACFDESMRLSPPIPGILPREVLPGGLHVDGFHLPAGTDLGVPIYALHHSEEHFPDPWSFKPSRWIAGRDDATVLVSEEDVRNARAAFCPFGYGRTNCVGKQLAYQEMALTIARLAWSYEWRVEAGSTAGEGRAGLGWGRERKGEFQLWDKFISSTEGPMVEFKSRAAFPLL